MGNCVKIRKTGGIVLEMINSGRFTKDVKRTDSQLNNRLLELSLRLTTKD